MVFYNNVKYGFNVFRVPDAGTEAGDIVNATKYFYVSVKDGKDFIYKNDNIDTVTKVYFPAVDGLYIRQVGDNFRITPQNTITN